MLYEFKGCDNPKCPDKKRGRKFIGVENIYAIPYPMKEAPALDSQIPCPRCKTGKITRIISSGIVGVVKATLLPDFQHGQSYMADVAGKPTKITFVDHPHTDPNYECRVAKQAAAAGVQGVGKAYYNEKYGRLCVDVASDVVDPLGKMNRDPTRQKQKVNVGQKYARKKAPQNAAPEKSSVKMTMPMRRFQ